MPRNKKEIVRKKKREEAGQFQLINEPTSEIARKINQSYWEGKRESEREFEFAKKTLFQLFAYLMNYEKG